jgi:hypothetical protein
MRSSNDPSFGLELSHDSGRVRRRRESGYGENRAAARKFNPIPLPSEIGVNAVILVDNRLLVHRHVEGLANLQVLDREIGVRWFDKLTMRGSGVTPSGGCYHEWLGSPHERVKTTMSTTVGTPNTMTDRRALSPERANEQTYRPARQMTTESNDSLVRSVAGQKSGNSWPTGIRAECN